MTDTATGQPGTEVGATVAVLTALQALETAIHAPDAATTLSALQTAHAALQAAAADFAASGDAEMATLATGADTALQGVIAAGVPSTQPALGQLQAGALSNLLVATADIVGVPVEEAASADAQANDSANAAVLGVVGLVLTVMFASGYIDGAQRSGGYPRGPRGVPRAVLAYDYPQ